MVEDIGRYQLQEKLGEGAMAVVHKAFDPSINRTLAIKFLRKDRCSDPEYRARFLREAKAAGILSHANVSTVFDVGEADDRPFIVMEYLEGVPLDEVMKSGETFPIERVATYGIQLSKALAYAHNKGIVHRDVKPSNIIRLANSHTLKVTDFGIARMEDKEATRQTQMGQVLGTPQYMSPEQVLGKEVDGRSDLFSLGVVLYQLVSGQKPFEADTLGTLLFRIATEDPKPLAEVAPHVPPSFQRVIERLLQKKPERRYQRGEELTQALIRTLKEIQATEEERDTPRIIPLRIKWSAFMACTVAVTMLLGTFLIHRRQQATMMGQVTHYGSSMARFVALESAVPILSEDWVSIELFVGDVMEHQDFSYLEVVDDTGVIRGSSDQSRIDTPYAPPAEAKVLSEEGAVRTTVHSAADGNGVLDFSAPILFQEKEIGRLHLGLPKAPFEQVSRLTVNMLLLFLVVTVVAVSVLSFVLATLLSAPINLTFRALQEVKGGNLDHRIDLKRNDEFGRVFHAFNEMAHSLQEPDEPPETPAVPPESAG